MNEQRRLWDDELDSHVVFFAAKPDAGTEESVLQIRQDLVRRQRLSAKLVPPERLHVSLLGVGEFGGGCPRSILEDACAIADNVSMAPFTVTFDRVASFGGRMGRRSIVLLGGEDVAGFHLLHETLSLEMARVGLLKRSLQRNSFTPHMTMMHANRACDAFAIEPVSWTVDEFFLIDSLHGKSKHEQLGRWPLVASENSAHVVS